MNIKYIDRNTGKVEEESVYGERALKLVYGSTFLSKIFGSSLCFLSAKLSYFSALYGFYQRLPITKRKIIPFIKKYKVDSSEFLEPIDHFQSFNDFFIRKLKPEARPISSEAAIIPADGRYYFYPNIANVDGFIVKGKKFNICQLLQNDSLAKQYAEGSMVLARLCPSDYHRFHFPIDCTPGNSDLINGYLYSVNPIAIKRNIHIFNENKRTLCTLQSSSFGKVLFMEIGATCVGSINQTYQPNTPYKKGDEKGFFAFGGSSLILLFPKDSILFDRDLITATEKGMEIRCFMGQSMGLASNSRVIFTTEITELTED